MKKKLSNISSLVSESPDNAFFVFRPKSIERSVKFFKKNFAGNILYAVKTNPEDHVLASLKELGVSSFDVASIEEIRRVRKHQKKAKLYFMHPVKSRNSIREAYFEHGVRNFSLDSIDELEKIYEETDKAQDLSLFVRMAIPNTYAELNLADKFGVNLQQAKPLLKKVNKYASKVGVCFHVGSQCMNPDAYRIAMRMVAKVIKSSGVVVDYFNVGGGFPSIYPGMMPSPLGEYFDAIREEFEIINSKGNMELFCEPGRAIVAESTSVVVRVELRKDDALYINDGTYGSLFDAGTPNFIFPVRLVKGRATDPSNLIPYCFYGPTCDSLDFMKGPFYLPEGVSEGDYIEIGQIGAYGRTLATRFNGFGHEEGVVFVDDDPLMTLYDDDLISNEPLEIIAA